MFDPVRTGTLRPGWAWGKRAGWVVIPTVSASGGRAEGSGPAARLGKIPRRCASRN